jgi:hypothetical protein
MSEEQRLDEQLLSHEAEKRLSDQLDKVEKINVDVHTDIFKVFQGQADGVSVAGKGLEIQDIRIEDLRLETDNIAVNPLSALFGQVELNQPVNTTARAVLTETDLNRALKSKYIRSQMQNFELNVDGDIVCLQLQEIQVALPVDGKISLIGRVLIREKGKTAPLSFTAIACPRTQNKPIMLENFTCTEGDGISLPIVVALMNRVKELVELPYFQLEDMAFRIRSMDVQKGRIILLLDALLRKIPEHQ